MKMTRKIILLMVFCFFLISTCFAETSKEKTDDQYFVIVNQTKIYAKNLVVTDGEGAYDGYLKMSGYPRDDKFQIYFQDTSDDNFTSMHVTYQDLRGIDLNEYFYFTYNETEYKITRAKTNNVFLSYPGTAFELFLRKNFPGAYNDWFETQAFSTDAERIVQCYIDYKHKANVGKRGNDTVKLDSGGVLK
jgi:hypothetical protein